MNIEYGISQKAPKLKLIGDVNSFNFRITYQYVEYETELPVGPKHQSMQRAQEWYRDWHNSFYEGEERRKSKQDRRRSEQRRQFELRSAGRRKADQDVEFEDRVRWLMRDISQVARKS